MAKTTKKYPDFAGYVRLYFEDSHLEAISDIVVANKPVDDQLQAMVYAGYKLSFSYNPTDNLYEYSAQDIVIGRTSAGYMFTGTAPSLYEAMVCVLYKHYNLMGANWVPFCTAETKTQRYR